LIALTEQTTDYKSAGAGGYEPFLITKPKLNDLWYRNEMIKLSNETVNEKMA